MILITVDLPAPLSPSSPRTSPLRRCRLMSRSAEIGPNCLATCSTRSTSSGASWSPSIRSPAKAWSGTAGPQTQTAHQDVERHRDDDRDPDVQVLVVGAHTSDHESVLENAEE